MISDAERREVAAKLSGEAQAWRDTFPDEVCDLGDVSALMQDLCHFAGLRGKVSCGDIFQRFADLIEPQERTCKIEGTYDDEFGIYDHLTCGHVAMRQWPEPTNYCPHCGAEVVE